MRTAITATRLTLTGAKPRLVISSVPTSAIRAYNKKPGKRKLMNHQFDELAKGLAQSVTRRQAFRRIGVGLASAAVALLGLRNDAHAGGSPGGAYCFNNKDCASRICKKYKVPCGPG